jgi:hypothetical protein
MGTEYFQLFSKSMSPCTLSTGPKEERPSWSCAGCRLPRSNAREIDVRIQGRPSIKSPLNSVFGYGVGLARVDFLQALGEHETTGSLFLGQVILDNGKRATGWTTFNGKHRVLVRGSRNSRFRRCDTCGLVLYFASGRQYLHPEPATGIDIFDAGYGCLVVTPAVFSRLDGVHLQRIHAVRLPVLSAPRDGFGELTSPS